MNEQDGGRKTVDTSFNAGETGANGTEFEMSDDAADASRTDLLLERVGGRRLVMALGGLFVAAVAFYPFLPLTQESADLWATLAFLAGVPGLVLLFGGYRLPKSDIRPEFFTAVGKWCLIGIGVGLVILFPVVIDGDFNDAISNGLLLTALGSLGGFAAGVYDARARTRQLELEETIEQLQMSNERLEQFAYATSHDLQEPLRMVSSYLQLLETRYRDELDDDAEEFIDYAVDGADRMRMMIDSLLDYSRVTTRGSPLEPTDAGAVLDDVCDDLEERIELTDATITADELPTVMADESQLGQMFWHLLSNAIEYSGDEPPRVHVSAERAGEMWRISVEDRGIGIDPEFHERIFEVFEKAHAGKDAPAKGSGGIGLALCNRIVERHGGDIWVESTPGDGSTFTFTLPAEE